MRWSWKFACGGFRRMRGRLPRSKRRWDTPMSALTPCSTAISCVSSKPRPCRKHPHRRQHRRGPADNEKIRRYQTPSGRIYDWPTTCRRDESVPIINGKYYINPTFGRAVELARMKELEEGVAEQQPSRPAHSKHHRRSGDNYNPATSQEGVANQVYNE